MQQEIEDLDKVKRRISFTGFGAVFNQEIDMRIEAGEMRFQPKGDFEIEGNVITASPEININTYHPKDDPSELRMKAYFNGYEAVLQLPGSEPVRQWFPASDRVTLEEAYRMLLDKKNPRAVQKEYLGDDNKSYKEWLQIDFNQKTKNDNHVVNRYLDFDVISKLKDYALEGFERRYKLAETVLRSGGEIEASPTNREKYERVLITANPDYATLTFRDLDGNILEHDQFRTPEARQRIKEAEAAKGPAKFHKSTISFVPEPGEQQSGKLPQEGPAPASGSLVEAHHGTAENGNTEKSEATGQQAGEGSKKNDKQGRIVLEEKSKRGRTMR